MGKHFPLNLSKFKKVSEDQHQATLVHPDGHQITIAKKPLSAKLRGEIAGLPLAEGGEVPFPSKANAEKFDEGFNRTQPAAPKSYGQGEHPNAEDAVQSAEDQPEIDKTNADLAKFNASRGMADGGKVQNLDDGGTAGDSSQPSVTVDLSGGAPQIPESLANANQDPNAIPDAQDDDEQRAPVAAPSQQMPNQAQPDPFGNEAYNNTLLKGINEQKAGIAGEAQATSAEAGLQNKVLDQQVQQQQDQMDNYNQHYASLQQEYDNFQKDVQNQHIDPNHYLNSMGTGQRISTAIGLIMGGIGGGLTHQGNPALDFLNRQIQNDIASQQSNLGKSENLLNANLRQFGNLRDASQMTMAMQQGIVANKLRQAAAQTTDQMAKSRALQAAGQLDQQSAPILSQIAMRRAITSGANQGRVDPSMVIRAYVPPQQQDQYYKELQTAQNMTKSRDNILGAYDQVNNMVLGGAFSPNQRSALVDPVLAQMVKDSEGRITPQDTKMIEGLFPKWNDTEDTRTVKRDQLNKFISEKMNFPMLQPLGIDPSKSGRYDQYGRPRIQESAPKLSK